MDKPRDFVVRPLPLVLHRVGWASSPTALRPWSTITADTMAGRFDDPNGRYRTFYAASTPEAALREKLLSLRHDHAVQERLAGFTVTDQEKAGLAELRHVPASFLTDFVLTTVEVIDPCDVVDITSHGSLDAYCDYSDRRLTVGSILDSDDTRAAQLVGLTVWRRNYAGIAYPSKHGTDLTNFALFETDYATDQLRVGIRQTDVQALDENCDVLRTVADELGFSITFPTRYDTRALWVQSLRDTLGKLGTVTWYDRAGHDRGVRYYSMRVAGLKISAITFAANANIEVDAITATGSAHTIATTSAKVEDVLSELSLQEPSVAEALAAIVRA